MAGRLRWLGGMLVTVALVSCGGDDSAPKGTDPSGSVVAVPAACTPDAPPLVVDQIDEALAAVAADRPGPQRFFEVNATASVVNLFLATTDGSGASAVIPYSWAGGTLRAEDVKPATGNTFEGATIAIDGQRVLSCVVAELPASTLDAFVIEGGADGAVRYSVVLTSQQGGQLVVEVTGAGQVVAVDAV